MPAERSIGSKPAWLLCLAVLVIGNAAQAQSRASSSVSDGDAVDRWSSEVLEAVKDSGARLGASQTESGHLSEAAYSTFSRWSSGGVPLVPNAVPSLSPRWIRPSDAQSVVPLMRQILRSRGLPEQLIAVALVESGFNPSALSVKGARGLWQLMPGTALRFGLRLGGPNDERLDPARSTRAAARYLEELYGEFEDWPLTLAAYNSGAARVRQALSAGHVRTFWELSRLKLLPEETIHYVPAVVSAARRFGGNRSFTGWD